MGIPKFSPVLSLQYLASGVTDGDYELSFVRFSSVLKPFLMMMMKGLAEEARIFVKKVLVLFSWESLDSHKAGASVLLIISG